MNGSDSNSPSLVEKRRLLFVVNDAAFFLSHRLPIAEAARTAGWEVAVAAPEGRGALEIVAEGLEFHPILLSRRGARPWEEARSLTSLVRLFRREQPDIVHLVTIKPVLYGGVAARLAGIRGVVSAVSGLGTVFLAQGWAPAVRRKAVEAAYRLAFGHSSQRVILQNPDDMEMFVSRGILGAERAVLIRGSGVNLEAFSEAPEPEGTPLVVLAARMLKDKGVVEFVEAARRLRADGVKARFALVGPVDPGNASAISEAQLRSYREDEAVEWWGARTDMPQVLAGCHIVCLPSYGEGVPKVLLEAAASGRPIVTTDVSGCREVVSHEHNGLLVPSRNAPALAAALRRLIDGPAERRAMGAAGRARAVREFSIGSVVDATLQTYAEVLSGA